MPTVDTQTIQCRQTMNGRTAGVEVFLDVLGRLGDPAWPDDFRDALQENGQHHLADLLEQEYKVVQEKFGQKPKLYDHMSKL